MNIFFFQIIPYNPYELSSIGKGHCTFVQGPGFEPGMPTYSPLKGEFLAARLPDQKKKRN